MFLANASSIHTVKWVNALSCKNHEVHLVYKYDDVPKDNGISEKVILHRLKYSGTKGYFVNVMQVRRLFKSLKPDVVNAHYASGYGTLARLSKLRPLVLSVWGSDVFDFPYQSKLKMRLVVKNLLFADHIASTSYNMAEQVKKLVEPKKIDINITPFGVDISHFCRNMQNNKEEIVIGNIKSLKKVYGIDYLINSIYILLENLNNSKNKEISDKIVVKIYGDGDQKEELERLVKKLNLESKIMFMGRIQNDMVPKALEEIDIFCVTSIRESFGVSLIEAMALEIPVVATDNAGFREILEDGITGLIVEGQNSVAISKALEKLVLDKEMRLKMGRNGRKKVVDKYDWDKNVDKMVELYKKCVKI